MQKINEILEVKLLEQHKSQEKRDYLGASMLGDECTRKIQLQYMKHESDVSAQNLRTFAIGHCLEDLIAEWLWLAGFDLKIRNENGEQFGFSVADGKIAGHCDRIIFGGPDFMRYPALWECKTLNSKSWNDTQKRGVLVSKPLYFSQVQLYMAYLNLDENPCLFTALNKDTSELYHELIPYLEIKKIKSHRLKIDRQTLLIPLHDEHGNLTSLQKIWLDSKNPGKFVKGFLKGSRLQGNCFTIGEIKENVVICEGYATGATIYEITGIPVVVAFSSNNLLNITHQVV
jgi:hypothetical protein